MILGFPLKGGAARRCGDQWKKRDNNSTIQRKLRFVYLFWDEFITLSEIEN